MTDENHLSCTRIYHKVSVDRHPQFEFISFFRVDVRNVEFIPTNPNDSYNFISFSIFQLVHVTSSVQVLWVEIIGHTCMLNRPTILLIANDAHNFYLVDKESHKWA